MPLSSELAGVLGDYFGPGAGAESGTFSARIALTPSPNGGVLISYEATSVENGVQHRELTMLAPGPDGRDRLYIAHSESPFVTQMVETTVGSGRFVQPEPFGPYEMEIVIELIDGERITYAWWWGAEGQPPVEQSKADVRRHG